VIDLALVQLLPEDVDRLLAGEAVLPGLSPQDRDLLRLAARGKSVREIARSLEIADRTVQRRLTRFRDKLGVGSTAELVSILVRHGF
jgi:DNA-binding CsgD family transcriptional regulator